MRVFGSAVPEALVCPQCKDVLQSPSILVPCGHTFCDKCVASITATSDPSARTCPLNNEAVLHVVPNRAVVLQVKDIPVYCKYGVVHEGKGEALREAAARGQGVLRAWRADGTEVLLDGASGCTTLKTLSTIESHECECSFQPQPCPYNPGVCGTFNNPQAMDAHVSLHCSYVTCGLAPLGCAFRGTRRTVLAHELNCTFVEDPLVRQAQQLDTLRTTCQSLRDMLSQVDTRVKSVEQNHVKLEILLKECLKQVEMVKKMEEKKLDQPRVLIAGSAGPFFAPQEVSEARGELVMPFNFQCIGTFSAHVGPIWCITSSQSLLFSSGSDQRINVWDLASQEPRRIKVLTGHTGVVHSLYVHDSLLYSGDADHTVHVWDISTLEHVSSFATNSDIVCDIIAVKDFLVTASYAKIEVWDLHTYELVREVSDGLNHWVRALKVDNEQRFLYSVCHKVVNIWNVSDFSHHKQLDTSFGTIHSLALTNAFIILGTYNQNIHLYDRRTLEHKGELKGYLGTVHALDVSVSGQFLFSASVDGTVKIWNLENMLLVQNLQRHQGSVNSIHWDNNLLFSGSADKSIKVYKPFKGKVTMDDVTRTPFQQEGIQACWGGGKLPPPLLRTTNVAPAAPTSPMPPRSGGSQDASADSPAPGVSLKLQDPVSVRETLRIAERAGAEPTQESEI